MSEQNLLGLTKEDYTGSKSTLCTGCGHDSITNHIVNAFYKSSINPYKVAKMSGIGCSSKTPAYFLGHSHGFNSIHGRMAPMATGAYLANPELTYIGVSGDGDTASIGLGSFVHTLRRNVPMIYIVENNGVYGLTKGQFSATADEGSLSKGGEANPFQHVDLCALALEAGCQFVARSFSGDAKQLVPLLNAALRHRGVAFLDVISPCVTFANHEGSTKSFDQLKTNNIHLQELGFIQPREEIKVDYEQGTTTEVSLADDSRLVLRKLENEHDITDKDQAFARLRQARRQREILTGLFYWNRNAPALGETMGLATTPLTGLTEAQSRPSGEQLKEILGRFR